MFMSTESDLKAFTWKNELLFWGDAHEWGRPVSVLTPTLVSVGWWGWNLACWKRTLRTGTCKWMMYCHCLWRRLLLLFSKRTCMTLPPAHISDLGTVWFVDLPLPSTVSQPLVMELAWSAGGFRTVWGHTHQMTLTHWDCHTGWILSSGLNPACPTRWKIPAFSCGPGAFLLSLLPLSAFHWSWAKSLCCVLCPVNNLMCNWGSYLWNLISLGVLLSTV